MIFDRRNLIYMEISSVNDVEYEKRDLFCHFKVCDDYITSYNVSTVLTYIVTLYLIHFSYGKDVTSINFTLLTFDLLVWRAWSSRDSIHNLVCKDFNSSISASSRPSNKI